MKPTFSLLRWGTGLAFLGVLVASFATTQCAEFAQGLNDLTTFCKAVGEKCTAMNAADCVQKLGADTTVLKKQPDYKAAKECVDGLTSCTTLPDRCWFHAVERFTEGGPQENPPSDGGGSD